MNRDNKVLVGVLIAIFIGVPVVGGLFFGGTNTASTVDNRGPARVEAFVKSQTFVTRQLKSPGTAEFPYITDSEVSITYHGDNLYTVVAYVDAQNGFGANIRTHYRCQLKDDGDKWKLISLNTF